MTTYNINKHIYRSVYVDHRIRATTLWGIRRADRHSIRTHHYRSIEEKEAAAMVYASRSSRPASVLPNKTPNIREHYKMGKMLGQGLFGTTFLCTEVRTGRHFACKSIPKRKMLCKEDFEDVWREIQIMHHVAEQPNVVRIKDAYEDAQHVHVVMELCAGGELFDRIARRGHYSEREASRLMKTIVGVVEECHSLGVVHRDLHPENFLFLSEDEEAALKVTDFGRSVFYKPGDELKDLVGTLTFVAPEVFGEHYGPEADVWSVGVILYMLLSGDRPFMAESEEEVYKEILYGKLDLESGPWRGISDSAKDLIRNMLKRNPKERFTAYQVLCHPWIVDDSVPPRKPLDSAILSRLKHFSAMNKFKKMAAKIIAENLSEEEIGGLKEWFKIIDKDNSGTISYDELKEGLRRVGSQLTETEIRSLMDATDIDGNGIIDYGEFIAATMHFNKMLKEENLFSAFSYFDKDSSGFITIDELQKACQEIGLSDSRLDEVLREVDENNDGKIDYTEFAAMMRKGNGGLGIRMMKNNLAGLKNKLKAAGLQC